jgi:hypothetical protein
MEAGRVFARLPLIAAWIPGQARNDNTRCHPRLDPESMLKSIRRMRTAHPPSATKMQVYLFIFYTKMHIPVSKLLTKARARKPGSSGIMLFIHY